MTAGGFQNSEMEGESIQPGETQADFIQKELNFDVNVDDPLTKATLSDHPVEEWVDILGNGQLRKKVVTKGHNGIRPNRGNMCTVKIVGKLSDGTVVEEHEDLTIQLGDVEVVQGLDLAITLMEIGEVAQIEVDPRFAYGELGLEPNIPPRATIMYTVELKSCEPEPEMETLNITQRKEIGNKKRKRGNWWFTRNEPTTAMQCYRRALEFLMPEENSLNKSHVEVEESASDALLQALLEDRIKIYNNLAAAQMKTQAYDAALKNVDNVLSCQPQNVKALFRKGKILHYKGEHSQAYAILLQVAKLSPDSKAIQAELATLKEKNAKDAQHEKNLYRKMLGSHKNNIVSPKNTKNSNKNTSATKKVAWSLMGGVTVATIGVLVYKFVL